MKCKSSIILVVCFVVSLCAFTTLAQGEEKKVRKMDAYPEVTIKGTEVRSLKSKFIDQEYKLQIYLPPSYSSPSKSFPVLYLLDADKSFGMAKDIIELLILGEEIPEIIIVGIAYEEGTQQWWAKRSRDYTPSKDRTKIWGDWPLAGGGKNFVNFIEKELIPFIDGSYRTLKNDRTLAGISLGGLFATYVLFTKPNLFNRYIISGPALLWDDKIVFKYEREFAKNHDTLPAVVFSSVGELDDSEKIIEPWKEFSSIVEKRNYNELKITNLMIEEETHFSVAPVSFTKGIKTVFADD